MIQRVLILGVVAGCSRMAAAQHEHSIIDVGRGASGELVMHTHATMPLPMPESTIPTIPGYAMLELAFESLQAPNAHGSFPLLPGSDIRLVLVSIDPGLTLYDGLTPLVPGGELVLGAPFFHFVPLWTIAPGPTGGVFSAMLRARDVGGMQTPSADFNVSFTPVPGTGTGVIAGAGLAWLGRRRRRVGRGGFGPAGGFGAHCWGTGAPHSGHRAAPGRPESE